MPVSVLLMIAVVSASIGLLAFATFAGPRGDRKRVNANLQRGLAPSLAPDAIGVEQAVSAMPDRNKESLIWRLTPASAFARLDRLHSRAGRPADWPVERLVAGKLLLGGVAAGFSLLIFASRPGALTFVMGLLVTVVCYFLPELLLTSRAQERSQAIALELADTLDQMTIAVQAGLAFDSAMAQAAKNGKGPLAQELTRTLQDLQMGASRREAYEALGQRSDVPDLRRFVRAVIQASAYGISIADVLSTQADEMRLKRRQRAEEKAMQIPVKVIFPLMLFILPVLFIVLLAPAVLGMIEAFSS
jgi:tight adherence protein C